MTKKKRGRPKKGDLEKGNAVADALTTTTIAEREQDDPYDGLSDRQRTIARMRLRGLTQKTIAKFLGVSQPVISKECKRIREHMQARGESIDQDVTIGETVTLYEEVEYKAWELYHTGEAGDKAKALSLIMQARDKHVKLLMDVGRLERAGNKTSVELSVSPLVKNWDDEKKSEVVDAIVTSQLTALPEPEPPEEDYIDAELINEES